MFGQAQAQGFLNFFNPSPVSDLKKLDDPQVAAGPSQAFADTPIGQSLLKLDESQRKRHHTIMTTTQGLKKCLGRPKPRAFKTFLTQVRSVICQVPICRIKFEILFACQLKFVQLTATI
jgi:hypothetical protein